MDTLKLTNETIDLLSEKITQMYKACNATKKDTLRARLLLEETLIKYQNHFSEDIELSYRQYRIFGQNRFTIHIKAPSFDPFTLEENPMAFMIESVMKSFEGNIPSWKFRNLENEIVFTVRKKAKLSGIAKIGIAVGAAVAVSLPVRMLVPSEFLNNLVTNYLDPLASAYAGLFCIMAVLLTFFAIALSIVRIGDLKSVGITGGRIFRKFYLMMIAIIAVLLLPILPTLDYSGMGSISLATKSIYDILIGFIPSNIVSPFLDFNSIHIIIIGAMFGLSLLVMGQKGETMVKLFDECNNVAITTNSFLNKFIVFYVALEIFNMVMTSDPSTLADAGKLIALIVVGELLIFVFYTIYVSLRCKIKLGRYLKIMLPSFVICLSSANFGAAFQSIVDGLVELKSFNKTAPIAINLGSVIFRPACALVFTFSSLVMANMYGVEMSTVWVVTAVLLSLILTAAVPNIPGVSVSVITLLFAQLGLPSEAIAMMIAINAPLQFLTVAVDTWCLSAECVCLEYADKKKES